MSTAPATEAEGLTVSDIRMCQQCWEEHGRSNSVCGSGCGCHRPGSDERCKECKTFTPIASLTLGYCQRCVDVFRCQSRWCGTHGPTDGQCRADAHPQLGIGNSINRLRGPSAAERLIAGLDRDAADGVGRIKGVLSLCGRGLTDSEVERVRAQVRAELASFLIKATDEINREWFDMVAVRGVTQ